MDIAKCNGCHSNLSLHGENRNQIEQCVLCHNPSENDGVRRAVATDPADKAQPNQSVNFALMIHKIHTGEGCRKPARATPSSASAAAITTSPKCAIRR